MNLEDNKMEIGKVSAGFPFDVKNESTSIGPKRTGEVKGEDKQLVSQNENGNKSKQQQLADVVKSMNDFLQPTQSHLEFEMHEKLNEYYVKIINNHTKEVIREIPSKKMLDAHAAMKEFLGLIIDKKL
jgi:flagellar protein FlaG